MLLAVNVSNSQILLGGYDGSRLVFCARVHADRAWTADEYAVQFSRVLSLYGCEAAGIKGIIFSCVVPALAETVRRALAMLYRGRIYTVGPGLKTGLQMHMDDPAQLGGELVCCAVAARALGPLPCVAVLMDTAISMVALDKNGVLCGGAILPGVRTGYDALCERTARPCLRRAGHQLCGLHAGGGRVRHRQHAGWYAGALFFGPEWRSGLRGNRRLCACGIAALPPCGAL